jgi:hypothetical protein
MRWAGGRVTVEDSVAISRAVTGKEIRDRYLIDIRKLTLGLTRMEGTSLRLGPLELLRFGRPKVTRARVDWPIEGGLAAGAPGGRFTIAATGGHLVATLDGYRPRVPVLVYAFTQLQIHHLITRLHLLRVRGRQPSPGMPAEPATRLAAGAIDAVACGALALFAGRGRRLRAFIGVAAGYHVACWSVSGRTFGGAVMGQRVVAVDGSKPSPGQAALRFVTLPLAAFRMNAVHDEIACTEVVTG